MSTAAVVGVSLFASVFALTVAATLRGNRQARRAIHGFASHRGWRPVKIQRHWFNWGSNGLFHQPKSVFKAVVTDAEGRTFAVCFQFEHGLLGGIVTTEAKFEHVGRL